MSAFTERARQRYCDREMLGQRVRQRHTETLRQREKEAPIYMPSYKYAYRMFIRTGVYA